MLRRLVSALRVSFIPATSLVAFLAACGGAVEPIEGVWRFETTGELERSCAETLSQGLWSWPTEYALRVDDDAITFAWPEHPLAAIHECTREGDAFDCPSVFLVGACFESTDEGFHGQFVSETKASGEVTFTNHCSRPPEDTCTNCDAYGGVSPCTITRSFTAERIEG